MLAADLVVQLNSAAWSDTTAATYSGTYALPAHKKGSATTPAGGNEVFVDGSVWWYNSSKMFNLYSTTGASQYNFYFFQDDWGGSGRFKPQDRPVISGVPFQAYFETRR